MFRGLLIATATLAVLIATVVGVVGAGLRSIAAAKKQANASWHPAEPPPTPASQPTTAPTHADDQQYVPEFDSIELWAADATPHGSVSLVDPRDPQSRLDAANDPQSRMRSHGRYGRQSTPYLHDFRTIDDYAVWELEVTKPGVYEIDITCACAQWSGSGRYRLTLNGMDFPFNVEANRGPADFRVMSVGKLILPAGNTTLTIRTAPTSPTDHAFLNLRNVLLAPIR